MITGGLEKREAVAVTSGGLTDIWPGEHERKQVAIKAFRVYPDEHMREAKKVRIECA